MVVTGWFQAGDTMCPTVTDLLFSSGVLTGPKRCDCNWDQRVQDVFSG